MSQRQSALLHGNTLKLGIFGANCVSGRTYAALPERWDASWEHNVALAQLTEAVGLECMIPIARWKGYGGVSNPNGSSFETLAWACGLLASTQRLAVFCTLHVPLYHPLLAARQMATVAHVGAGRLGVNLVCGWNEDEFQMFGLTKQEHDERYAQGAEWWQIVQQIWAGTDPFDYQGHYYQLRGVEGLPRPYGGQTPLMMNAGSSPAGRQFAIQHSDLHFDALHTLEDSRTRLGETKRLARQHGREIQVWTPVGIVCRPSQRQAEDYMHHVVEHADWGALGYLTERQTVEAEARPDAEVIRQRRASVQVARRVLARSAYCTIGDPDAVARELALLASLGFDGLAINFVDYLAELPYFVETVLPRLERLGLRAPIR